MTAAFPPSRSEGYSVMRRSRQPLLPTRDERRPRVRRIAELLKRELAAVIEQELHDPRVTRLTLTAVDVAPDLSHAKVYITQLGGAAQAAATVAALNRAGGFLRRTLSRRLTLRVIPELRFGYDASVEKGAEVSRLIDRALAEDRAKESGDD